MENERTICPSDEVSKSSRVQKSLFVLNAEKTNLNVNAVSFALNQESNIQLPTQSNSNFSAGYSHDVSHSREYSFPRGLVMNCNPRVWRNISCRNLESSVGYDDSFRRTPYRRRHSDCNIAHRSHCPNVLPNGIIQLSLREGIKIDITLDKAIRLTNSSRGIDISIDGNGTSSAVVHPNGKVNQFESDVEVMAYDGTNKNDFVRYAKFWKKGISFTSSKSALVYRIDSGGVRSTGDTLTDLLTEHTISIFLGGSRHGRRYFEEAMRVASMATYMRHDDGTDEYFINGIRITQKPFNVVKIHRLDNNCLIGTNPENCSYTLTTTQIHSTAALRDTPHLFVRRSTQRVHFDGCCFLVRFDGNSAGFDDSNRLKVY